MMLSVEMRSSVVGNARLASEADARTIPRIVALCHGVLTEHYRSVSYTTDNTQKPLDNSYTLPTCRGTRR